MKKTYLLCCKLALTLFLLFIPFTSFSQNPISQTFTTSGSGSFTIPPGVTSIIVEAWGGGGRGGMLTSDGVGGGGGGGTYSRKVVNVIPGQVNSYVIGAGSSSEAAGGDSWFLDSTTILAKGGKSALNNQPTAGLGGLASESIGDVTFNGGNGVNGLENTNGGGGGSSAGIASAGTTGTGSTGGMAPLGGGNGGNGATANGNGLIAGSPGGGGGGARRTATGTRSGGNGGNGQIRITYTALSNGPGGITNNLQLWLRADLLNGTTTANDNQNVTSWQTQANGTNAVVANPAQAPKFRNTPTFNANFNAVVNFTNSPFAADTPGTALPQQYLRGDSGYFTQEMFVVMIPDNTVTAATSSTSIFGGDSNPSDEGDNDISGIGLGSCTARYDNEVISYNISSTPNDPTTSIENRGFGVAETSATKSYVSKIVGFINARNNTALSPNTQDLTYNGTSIGNTTAGLPRFKNFNSRFWIARNQDRKAAFNGNIAEVITYSSRKDDASERNRIESYLGIKYGITLGINGTSQNYLNSNASIIWNTTAISGYNFNIAGIGRDDASKLTQKQSKTVNSFDDVTIGLGEIALTNTANTNTFSGDRQFLVWGHNNSNLNTSGTIATTNLGGLTTNFISGNRKYRIVETGGDVGETIVSIPKTSLNVFTKNANQEYVLIVSSGPNFTSSEIIDIVPLTDKVSNYETWYDFDGVRYFSFGVANQFENKYRVNNQTADYFVGERNTNLASSFTVSFWIKTSATSGTILAKPSAFQFYLSGSKVIANWNGGDRITSTTSVNDGLWHYITVSYASNTANLYIDGVLDRTLTVNTLPNSNRNNFSIGANWVNKVLTNTFIGDIDEVRIWDTALTVNQIRYVMNQEIEKSGISTNGKIIPFSITKNEIKSVNWSNIQTYYDLNTFYGTSVKDKSDNNRWLRIKYLTVHKNTVENQTAPLPYVSTANGLWQNNSTWANGSVQTLPNATSIVNNSIPVNWNIVQTQNAVESQGNRTVLGLLVLNNILSATNNTKIEVTHYLKLNGKIDLVAESQLIQTLDSDLDVTSAGSIERDQKGKSNKFDYNYWSAPVNTINPTVNNGPYTIAGILKDGSSSTPQNIQWTTSFNGSPTSPVTISSHWIHKFQTASNQYANWVAVGQNGSLNPGQGFTMKGSGTAGTTNYTFLGKPNNGKIQFNMGPNLINLTGNPYASALNSTQFINDNIASTNGTLYFWDHFGGETHILLQYQGGYATLNLTGGVPAQSHPLLQNSGPGTKVPKQFVPVGQGFFINSSNTGGDIIFNNNQRFFVKESEPTSNPLMRNAVSSVPETDYFTINDSDVTEENDGFTKIRLGYNSRNDYHRQLLLGFMNENATGEIDAGYDAKSIDSQVNDMFFIHGDLKLVIQGDSYFNPENIYPLTVKCDALGTVKFMIDATENLNPQQEIYIFDNMTGIYHSIKNNNFEIELPEGNHDRRFSLRFTTEENLSTGDHQLRQDIHVAFTSRNNILHIKNNLIDTEVISATVFNMIGQKLTSYGIENQNQQSIQIPISNLSTGTYIIKITTTNGDLSKKIIIK